MAATNQQTGETVSKREKIKADRKQLIVEAAMACFVDQGIRQTGVRDIAGRAKVSIGNLYNHFAGKDDLIAEIAALEGRDVHQFVAAVESHPDPLKGIARFADLYLEHVSQPDSATLTIEIMAEALRNPNITEEFEANRARLINALCTAIRHGESDGTIRPGMDRVEIANLIIDAVEGLGMRAGMARKSPGAAARGALHAMIERSLKV